MNKININSIIRKCSFFALAGLLTSCVSESVTNEQCEKSSIILNLTIPSETVSRADNGGVTDATTTAEKGEATINDMKVWVFAPAAGDNAVAERYSPFASINVDNSVKLEIGIPRGFTRCDIYMLANSTSTGVGAALDATTTRAQLESAMFSSNVLPLKADKGLPLARIVKNVDVSSLLNNSSASLNIALLRSVSKLNLFFTKDNSLGSTEVKINSISITNSKATKGSVFPQIVNGADAASSNATESNVPSSAAFETTQFPIANSLFAGTFNYTVSKSASGALVRESNESGDNFYNRMTVKADLVEKAYFMESNQAAECTIKYTIGGEVKEKTFTLWTAQAGADLIRNHNVVIYGHFVGRDLTVTPTVLPWNDAETITYDLSAGVDATVEMINGKNLTSYIPAAYDAASTGNYYPQFKVTFKAPLVARWLLQSSNPDFGFKINLTDDIQDYIEGVGGANNGVTFYVVPKNEFDQTKYDAEQTQYNTTLFVTVPEIPSLGRVTFNKGTTVLPGTDQSVTIHQVSKTSY